MVLSFSLYENCCVLNNKDLNLSNQYERKIKFALSVLWHGSKYSN